MQERNKNTENLFRLAFGERCSLENLIGGFHLEGVGLGKVSLDLLGTEGSEYPPGPSLRVIVKDKLIRILRQMAELAIVIDWDADHMPVTKEIQCIVSAKGVEFRSDNIVSKYFPEDTEENYAIFNLWSNTELNMVDDFLLVQLMPRVFAQTSIRFEQILD